MLYLYSNPFLLDFLIVADQLPDEQRACMEAFTGEPYTVDGAAIGNFTTQGPKWTIKTEDHRPIAVGGYVYQRKGVWRDFMLSTPEAWSPENWFTVTRMTRRSGDAMFKNGIAHRLECVTLASRTKAIEWITMLGLHQEGILHGFAANGADAIMLARVQH